MTLDKCIPDRQKNIFWTETWKRHIETYLAAPPRAGIWIRQLFPSWNSVLEIAGGSCRDSRYLADHGFQAVGSDFEQKTIEYLQDRFPASPLKLQREDAFHLSFQDNVFDITFSNGFWILFDDNRDITSLIKEQARVTRKYMISFLHNGDNIKLKKTFQEKSEKDPLYNIRFFYKDEIEGLIHASGISFTYLKIKKFGGIVDLFYAKRIKNMINLSPKLITSLYDFQPWSRVERLAVIIKLA